MYIVYLVRLWSIAHLKACCWYIECGKAFCPVEEDNELRWRWTSIYFPRRRRTRFSTREKGMPTGPKLRLIGRPRGPRTRQKGMPRKVGDQGSQRRWLPPLLHLCCHRFPLHHSHRIPASGIPPVYSYHCQDFSRSHHRPSWTLQGELCMYRSSSLDPFCPLMHTMCNNRPSPRNGWI
jgi:hypothetical protein